MLDWGGPITNRLIVIALAGCGLQLGLILNGSSDASVTRLPVLLPGV